MILSYQGNSKLSRSVCVGFFIIVLYPIQEIQLRGFIASLPIAALVILADPMYAQSSSKMKIFMGLLILT